MKWANFEGRRVMSDYDVLANGIAICLLKSSQFFLHHLFFSFLLSFHSLSISLTLVSLETKQLKCSRLINFWPFSKAYASSGKLIVEPHKSTHTWIVWQNLWKHNLKRLASEKHNKIQVIYYTFIAVYTHSLDPVTYKFTFKMRFAHETFVRIYSVNDIAQPNFLFKCYFNSFLLLWLILFLFTHKM